MADEPDGKETEIVEILWKLSTQLDCTQYSHAKGVTQEKGKALFIRMFLTAFFIVAPNCQPPK